MPNITETLSQKGFAALCDVSPQTVSNWCEAGMPHEGGGGHGETRKINVRKALPWVVANRTEKPGSERERLAKEQADKIAIENAQSRKELIKADHVQDSISEALANLTTQLDGLPGRMATPLASIEDPALMRSKLQDEVRRIRVTYAQFLAELGELGGDLVEGKRDRKAPAKKKRKRVGRKKSSASRGER